MACRLTLASLLEKAGYQVAGAASTAEAISLLDSSQFQLVLADLRSESEDAGPKLLAYARQKDYKPATALYTSDLSANGDAKPARGPDHVIHMSNEEVSNLMISVAELIGSRADRRMRRAG